MARGRPKHPDILTPREWEVVELIRVGLSNEEIAERLGISDHTAKFHVSQILGKLGLPRRRYVVRWQADQRPAYPVILVPLALFRRISVFGFPSKVFAIIGATTAAGAAGALIVIGTLLVRQTMLSTHDAAVRPTLNAYVATVIAKETQTSLPTRDVASCVVDLPASWSTALAQGRIPIPDSDYLYASAVAADGSRLFGALHSDAWTGVVAVTRDGSITRIRAFDNPAKDQIVYAAFDGRWLVWAESHAFQAPVPEDIRAWNSASGKVLDLATTDGMFYGPILSDGWVAWSSPRGNLLTPSDLHLYSLSSGQDRVFSNGKQLWPVHPFNSQILVMESDPPVNEFDHDNAEHLVMVNPDTGELSAPGYPFDNISRGTFMGSGGDILAWSGGPNLFVLRSGDREVTRLTIADRDIDIEFPQIAGELITWFSTSGMSAITDLRSGSAARLPGRSSAYASGDALVVEKLVGTPVAKPSTEDQVTLSHTEIDVVDVADLPTLPGCQTPTAQR